MGDSGTTSKLRLTISDITIKPGQTGLTGRLFVFVVPAWWRRSPFFSGNLDLTSLNQERNSIPNEFVKLETLPRRFLHGVLLRHSEDDPEEASRNQISGNYGKRFC